MAGLAMHGVSETHAASEAKQTGRGHRGGIAAVEVAEMRTAAG